MKKLCNYVLILIVLFCLQLSLFSLERDRLSWEYFYGGANNDQANHILLTEDDGYIVAGYTESFGTGIWGKPDMWLLKIDQFGTLEWDMTYGQPDSLDKAYFIWEVSDGYILVGERMEDIVYGNGAGGVIVKTDFDGNEIWNKKYGGPEGDMLRHIQPTSDGGFIACGTTKSYGAGFIDGWILKIDADGNEEWNNHFGGTGYEVFKQVYQTEDGGFFAAGYTNSQGAGSYDNWFMKIDQNGNLEWEEIIGDENSNRLQYFTPLDDGNYIMTGETENASEQMELFVTKFDPAMNIIWENIYPANVEGEGKFIEQTADNGFIIGGTDTNSIGGPWQSDGWIIKIDENGNFEWDYFVHSEANEGIQVVRQTPDDGFIAGGWNMSYGAGMSDLWLLKLNEDGEVVTENTDIPTSIYRLQNFPNPFKDFTTITFQLSNKQNRQTELQIYNLKGQKFRQYSIFNPSKAGHGNQSSIVWDGKDKNGNPVSNGIYYCQLHTGGFSQTKKMILIK